MPKLVLLPGMDGTGELFADFVNALPKEFEAVTIRYPTDYIQTYAELALHVARACPISEPFVLVAESFSTPLAIQHAASHPTNLLGVVLIAGFASTPIDGWRRFLARCAAPFVFQLPLPRFAAKSWLVGEDAPPQLLMAVKAAVSAVQPQVIAARVRSVLSCDVREQLALVDLPILYVGAKHDRLVGASCLRSIQSIKPRIMVATFAGPHLLVQREPSRIADTVTAFVQRLA